MELDFSYGTSSNNGNVLSQTINRSGTSWQQAYSYDGLNRLSGASETVGGTASWTRDFGYDSRGNRWVTTNTNLPTLTSETPVASTWFGGDNRLSSWTYDSAGNVTAIANMTRSFTYDGENRQITADVGGVATSYFYDGEGRRVKKVTPSNTTIFVYDAAGHLAAEYGGPASSTGGTRYYTQDHLGSTRMITDSTGAVQTCLDYLPFGQELGNHSATGRSDACYGGDQYPSGTPSDDPVKFTGKERDSETGLDYFGARYFASAQGRFTSADPLFFQEEMLADPQRFNLYGYVRNNPLSFIDPTGKRIELTGETDEERKRQLAAIQAAVGEKAGGRLAIEQDQESGSFFVGITGDLGSFRDINPVASTFATIITLEESVKFDIVASRERMDLGDGKEHTLYGEKAIGATARAYNPTSGLYDGALRVFVRRPQEGYPSDGLFGSFGLSNNLGTVTGHEFGHALELMVQRMVGRGRNGNTAHDAPLIRESNNGALDLENKVRRLQDGPNARTKNEH